MTYITRLTLQGFKSFNRKISIPFIKGFNIICGPNGTGKSVGYNTEVLLSNGNIKPIGEIVESQLANATFVNKMDDGILTFENSDGLKVLGLNPYTMRIEEKPILAFIKRKGEDPLVKIITSTGKELVTTGDHPVMVYRNGEIIAENVNNLRINDLIATPKKINLNVEVSKFDEYYELGNLINKDFAKFIGYLIGDGYITKNCCEFVNDDKNIILDFRKTLRKLRIRYKTRKDKFVKRILIYSTWLSKILHRLFESKKISAENKSIPNIFLFSKEEIFTSLLAAIFDCDAYVRKDIAGIEYATKSPTLAKQLQFLLLRLGIAARLKVRLQKTANSNQSRRKYYYLYISGIKNLKKFSSHIKLKSEDKAKRLIYQLKRGKKPQRSKEEILPRDVNKIIKTCVILLGLKGKLLRKNFPLLSAYVDRCHPTINGLYKILDLFESKIARLRKIKKNIKMDKENLLSVLRELSISYRYASKIGLNPNAITSYWRCRKFIPRLKNLKRLYKFVSDELNERLKRAEYLLLTLKTLVSSDIFWDRIVKMEKVKGEEWVYDLVIPECHNFIGNLIFVHNSNLVDSICFVLGRTSAKSMRADRLIELIFHGGEKKKPAEYASVTLYLDNSKKIFPYDDEEISVTRKVNRSGISIYKINGRTVTREKVLQLLSAARIRPDGHNIILQGDVTNLIEMSPIERREIIDEISGIAEYNEKKERAMRDLETVEQRLKEAEIIISQRYEIFKKLRAERDAALRYQKLQNDLKILKASYLNKLIQLKAEKKERVEERVEDVMEKLEKIKQDIEKIEEDLEERENSLREVVSKLIELSKSVEIERELSEFRSKLLINREKIDSNLREIERIDSLVEKLEAIEKKKAELKGEIPNAVKAVLKLNLRGVYGTIENLISVPQEYKIAIEVAAGSHLFDIVVENDEIASFCINYLKEEKIGRATFLPLNKIKPIFFKDFSLLKEHGVIGVASKLIRFDPKFMRAIEFAFGNTLIVKDLEVAKKFMGRARVVTLGGDLIERSGAMIGGYYLKTHPESISASVEKEIELYRILRKRLKEEVEVLKGELAEIEKKMEKMEVEKSARRMIDLEKVKISSEREIDELRERRRSMLNKKVNLEIEINQLKIEQAKVEMELENLKKEISQYEVTHYIDEKIPSLLSFIKKAEKELQALGMVNLKAIEEYEKFRSEFDLYKEKYEKILEEKKAVLKMIEEIEEKRKEVFNKCLNEISNRFNSIFSKMFRGVASLELEDPDNLETGLLIKANPRGKTVLNIDSMSGGEKTLTALAFLFAIQKYKPAPFYVLDEIDAALDKENTVKLAELIKSFSKNEQFIIVTHNDQTIRYGDRVYGVTMSEGESKILGLEMPA